MSVKLAGGITVPFSKTKGTGDPSHWALKLLKKNAKFMFGKINYIN